MSVPISGIDITKWYLYGGLSAADLTDESLINWTHHHVETVTDFKDWFTNGPGRFAKPSQSGLISDFFNVAQATLDPGLDGEVLTLAQVMTILGDGQTIDNLIQAFYDDGKDDRLERAYIYNTESYKIEEHTSNGDISFVLR